MLLGVGDGAGEGDVEGGIELDHVHVLVFQVGQSVAVPITVFIHSDASLRLDGGVGDRRGGDAVFESAQGILVVFDVAREPLPAVFEADHVIDGRRFEALDEVGHQVHVVGNVEAVGVGVVNDSVVDYPVVELVTFVSDGVGIHMGVVIVRALTRQVHDSPSFRFDGDGHVEGGA